MHTVTINSIFRKKNKTELYQTLESLKSAIKANCKDLELKISPDNNLLIKITFENQESFEKNFFNNEFNILKGTVRSLCDNVSIKVNGVNYS